MWSVCSCPNGAMAVKPRVAALWRLPWEQKNVSFINRNAVAASRYKCATPLGLGPHLVHVSQGSRQSAATLGCKS
jgi:hypothetical protein